MARSENVYVVQDREDMVVAAFTVKHELCTWLYRRYDKNVYVTRVEDSPVGSSNSKQTNMPIEPLVEQGYRQDLAGWKRSLPEFRGVKPEPPK